MLYKKVMNETGGEFVEATPNEVREEMMAIDHFSKRGTQVYTPEEAKFLVSDALAKFQEERIVAFYFDDNHELIDSETIAVGTIDRASLYPREVVRAMVTNGATALILAHNHPAGEATASQADRRMTRRICDALGLIDCRLIDHIILSANGNRFSFNEAGFI
ncbi:JAB domain-containing protein [Vibrio owensii]|uniref:JAB domain-containing protein n=1 Tax=Vibrio owensii TaxID=696485 RepID=UPI0018F22303|nr:JAB domain-containing protein [Vibrio owensii]